MGATLPSVLDVEDDAGNDEGKADSRERHHYHEVARDQAFVPDDEASVIWIIRVVTNRDLLSLRMSRGSSPYD